MQVVVEHQMIYSPEEEKQQLQSKNNNSLLLHYPAINGNNLLTLLAADPPSSRTEWVLLHFSPCFPHLCWVPTDSFSCGKAGRILNPPQSADRFQEALEPGNCSFLCRAHL
jgi:hypothetical protein